MCALWTQPPVELSAKLRYHLILRHLEATLVIESARDFGLGR